MYIIIAIYVSLYFHYSYMIYMNQSEICWSNIRVTYCADVILYGTELKLCTSVSSFALKPSLAFGYFKLKLRKKPLTFQFVWTYFQSCHKMACFLLLFKINYFNTILMHLMLRHKMAERLFSVKSINKFCLFVECFCLHIIVIYIFGQIG